MKKFCIFAVFLLLFTAPYSWAALVEVGSVYFDFDVDGDPVDGGLYATGEWDDPFTNLSWQIYDPIDPNDENYVDDGFSNPDYWVYRYIWNASNKDLSHIIIEVSPTFTAENLMFGTTEGYEVDEDGIVAKTMETDAGDIFGIKWEPDDDLLTFDFLIVTDRMPMSGSFFAKSGNDVYARNTEFGNQGPDNWALGWIRVPDTTTAPVPEPATLLLLGVGLVGMGAYSRRKLKK